MLTQAPPEEEAHKAQRERLDSLRARQVAKAAATSKPSDSAASRQLVLRPYQLEAVEAACAPKEGVSRRLVCMATGGGKTVVIAEILNRLLRPGQSALVLAHRDELLSQAIAEIKGFVPDLHVEREQAGDRASRSKEATASNLFDDALPEPRRRVVVGSVQSMQRKRLESFAPDEFSILVIDEAHHAVSQSYVNIATYFGCLDDERCVPLIGVTATPQRSDAIGLDSLFQEMSTSHGIRDLVAQGHLCNIRALSVQTDTDLRGVKVRAGDYVQRDLEDATNTPKRNARVIAAHAKYAADRPTLCFATGVAHAMALAELFCAHGVPAEAIYGSMPEDERRAALQRYKDGVTRVLTNFAVLTEGVNLPSTACVLLARPTKSSLLVTQMLGRGTRLHEGKVDCLVLDMMDVTSGKEICTTASISGLPAEFDVQGRDVFKAKRDYDTLEEMSPHLAAQSMTAADVEKNIKLALELIRVRELDLLQREERLAAQKYETRFAWYRVGDYNFEISPDAGATHYQVFCDLDDAAAPWLIAKKSAEDSEWDDVGARYSSAAEAIAFADEHISRKHRNLALIDLAAPWMADPATDKQVYTLRKRFRQNVPENITKGEAAARLNVLFAQFQRAA